MIASVENVAVVQSQVCEAEQSLINRAQQANSTAAWEIGECASKWLKKFANGRTDAEFGELIGMKKSQIQQRRQVYERFAGDHPGDRLSWSHFRAAVHWDDADHWLKWAEDNNASKNEMVAARKKANEPAPDVVTKLPAISGNTKEEFVATPADSKTATVVESEGPPESSGSTVGASIQEFDSPSPTEIFCEIAAGDAGQTASARPTSEVMDSVAANITETKAQIRLLFETLPDQDRQELIDEWQPVVEAKTGTKPARAKRLEQQAFQFEVSG